ncbi:MAG: carboxypeptidase regulatory-like domain-containing protein [Verrucomicrobiota bacterium]|jgi:plastocyanin
MRKSILIFAVAALAGWFQAARAADVTGKVTLKGTPPAEKTIDFSANTDCGNLHPTVTTTRWYLVGKDNGLKDVFVYISKGCEGKTYPIPAEPVVLDQVKCAYQPYVLGVMAGQKLQVRNSDPILHNVHATPKVAGNEEFNIPQANQGQVNEKIFSKPEVMVRFKCDVHQWMFAYVGVVDNPFFAVTDADGNFKIPNLPPGDYTLTAYHVKAHGGAPGTSQAIKVVGDSPVVANFTVEVPQ